MHATAMVLRLILTTLRRGWRASVSPKYSRHHTTSPAQPVSHPQQGRGDSFNAWFLHRPLYIPYPNPGNPQSPTPAPATATYDIVSRSAQTGATFERATRASLFTSHSRVSLRTMSLPQRFDFAAE